MASIRARSKLRWRAEVSMGTRVIERRKADSSSGRAQVRELKGIAQ